MRYTSPALIDHLASGYVLGTLAGGARRRVVRQQRERADIRAQGTAWETRLGQLAIAVPPARPSGTLWQAIAGRTQPGALAASIAPGQAPQQAPVKAPPRSKSDSGWARWWRPASFGIGGLASGAIAASLVFLTAPALFTNTDQIAMRSGEKLPQSYVGLLTDAQGNGKLLVSSLRHGRTLTAKVIGPLSAPAAGRLVLWALPATGTPFRVGTMPTVGSSVIGLPESSEKLFSTVSKLAVTIETDPEPDQPGTNVVLSGNCAKLW